MTQRYNFSCFVYADNFYHLIDIKTILFEKIELLKFCKEYVIFLKKLSCKLIFFKNTLLYIIVNICSYVSIIKNC